MYISNMVITREETDHILFLKIKPTPKATPANIVLTVAISK